MRVSTGIFQNYHDPCSLEITYKWAYFIERNCYHILVVSCTIAQQAGTHACEPTHHWWHFLHCARSSTSKAVLPLWQVPQKWPLVIMLMFILFDPFSIWKSPEWHIEHLCSVTARCFSWLNMTGFAPLGLNRILPPPRCTCAGMPSGSMKQSRVARIMIFLFMGIPPSSIYVRRP